MSTSQRRTYVLALAGLLLAALPALAAPTASRSAPYPSYRVGGSASLTVSTSPQQIYAPVYQFRYKNGQPDGAQPTLVGYTNSSGVYHVSISSLPGGIEGSYTNERFAVGSPSGTRSPALNFTIAPATPLTVGCSCEHFGSQYDQICEAAANPAQAPYGGSYTYSWSTSANGYFSYPPAPTARTVVADCINQNSCNLSVYVSVDLVMGGQVVDSSPTIKCYGGTWVP